MNSNSIWVLVDPLDVVRPIGYKWIYKKKRGAYNQVETYKARLVVKGHTQRVGIHYKEIFYPIVILISIKTLLSITAILDYGIWRMDVKIVFLNGYHNEEIYMS